MLQFCTKKIIIVFIIIIISICSTFVFIFQRRTLLKGPMSEIILSTENNSKSSNMNYSQFEIHVVLVCAQNKFNMMAITTIKSIMFHHRKSYKLIFHIFTDPDGFKIIGNYFNSIINNCTNYQIYPIETLIEKGKTYLEKHHIVNTHYSGIYALSKAFVHEILPPNVTRILLIDTDILFVDDIYSIWKEFRLFKKNITALGLVPWYPSVPVNYTYKGSNPDSFLTGMVLLDLNVCRLIDFTKLLNQITDMAYEKFGLRSLWTADQVILSLFAIYSSKNFVSLPCYINGHTYHYLKDGATWKNACNGEYPRSLHIVPSSKLLDNTNYFGHLYIFFKDMPIEWLSYCNYKQS